MTLEVNYLFSLTGIPDDIKNTNEFISIIAINGSGDSLTTYQYKLSLCNVNANSIKVLISHVKSVECSQCSTLTQICKVGVGCCPTSTSDGCFCL